jgi:hypothetical protein
MTARYDLEHMSTEELENLKTELRSNPAMLQLLVDLKNSEGEGVDIDLLSAYVMSSSSQNEEHDSLRNLPTLPEDDIEYVEAMLKHSSAWSEVHQHLLLELQKGLTSSNVSEPLKPYQPKRSLFPAWLNDKSFAYRLAFSSFSFAAIFIIAILIIPDKPSLKDLQLKKPSVARSAGFSDKTGLSDLASDLANSNYGQVIKSLESVRGKGSAVTQIGYEVLLAKSYLFDAESSIPGLHRWFNEARLKQSLTACNTAISMIEKNAGELGSYEDMEYRTQALIVKTIVSYLSNEDAEAIKTLKQLSELRGPNHNMVVQLQEHIH